MSFNDVGVTPPPTVATPPLLLIGVSPISYLDLKVATKVRRITLKPQPEPKWVLSHVVIRGHMCCVWVNYYAISLTLVTMIIILEKKFIL